MPFIYSLSNPTTGEIRYVGKANDVNKRLKSHIYDSKTRNTPLYNWIRKLISNGLMPVINIICECDNWQERERQIIKEYRGKGFRLLNVAEGGDEPFCSIETRIKNGKKVSQIVNSDPNRKYVANLKRMLTKSLNYLSENGKTETYNRIINKLKSNYDKNPNLLGTFQTFNNI